MLRFMRRAAVLVVLAGLWAFVAGDAIPGPIALAHASVADDASAGGHYDLSALRIFNRVVIQIKDSYVDPKRVDPKLMLVAALDAVERNVAEVLVEGDEHSKDIKVTVGSATRSFDISGVDSLWKMSFTMRDVFDFMSKNLVSKDQDQREIEYAAINGMLSTLDPHSMLLKPDYFKEMKLQTKGEFGGLGFVIQMKDSNLTVVKVLKGTPASRGGVKSKDVITKIGEESTVNMDLNDAVSRLRGKPGSHVTITIARGTASPRPLDLTRAIITVEAVESKLLPKGVGYIRLKQFQSNSARDIQAALDSLKDQNGGPLKGLVLDLRGNPGGLLEEAIKVSDLFVSHGTIVTTVGESDRLREVKKAHDDDTAVESKLPLAVLVNAGSASASEIVAGALKNLNRAVIVGRRSFGKGSVQVLYDFPDDSALKLTIAQYLTPGDKSIQELGITPDVELEAAKVTPDRVEVFAPRKSMGEADLSHHLTNPADAKPFAKRADVEPKDKPAYTLEYLKDSPPKKSNAVAKTNPHEDVDLIEAGSTDDEEDADVDAEDQDTAKVLKDFQVLFARDLLLAAPDTDRRQIVAKAAAFMGQEEKLEQGRIASAIGQLGVDWSKGPRGGELALSVSPSATVVNAAGDTVKLAVTVKNDGDAPAYRVRGWTVSDNPYLDRREFVIGELAPHQSKTWTIPVKTPKDLISRRDAVTYHLVDDQGPVAKPVVADLDFAELPHPAFAYSVQVVDACKAGCNGDGITNPGEQVTLTVDVKNIGKGVAKNAYASIKNDSDRNVFIDKGRFKLGELDPGQVKTATFELQLKKAYTGSTYALKMAVIDEDMDEYLADRLVLPVSTSPAKPMVKAGAVRLGTLEAARGAVAAGGPTAVAILSGARGDLPPVATVKSGEVLPVQARVGDFYRVVWSKDRTGFVPAAMAHEVGAAAARKAEKGEGAAQPVMQRDEPQITVTADTSKGGIQTTADHFTLTGTATDPAKLRDLYVFVNDQKVYFHTTGDAPQSKIDFTTTFPLKPGNNSVIVVAREDDELIGRRSLVIRRDGGDASALHVAK